MRYRLAQNAHGVWEAWTDEGRTGALIASSPRREVALLALTKAWRAGESLTAASPPPEGGTPVFSVLGFTGGETDDGRMFDKISSRDMPIPFMSQFTNWGGHDGSEIVGRWDKVTFDGNRLLGDGWYDASPEAAKAIQQLKDKTSYGVSMDISSNRWPEYDCMEYDSEGWCSRDRSRWTDAVLVGATQVTTPAFRGAQLSLDGYPDTQLALAEDPPEAPEMDMDDLFWFFFNGEKQALRPLPISDETRANVESQVRELISVGAGDCGCDGTLTASAGPVAPPAGWFDVEEPDYVQPFTFHDDGSASGHIASWDTCHTGYNDICRLAPHSKSGYAFFHTGEITCEDGSKRAVGQLTFATGHASTAPGVSVSTVMAHYDNTGVSAVDLVLRDGKYGIWACGATRPHLTDEQLREIAAAAPSGDWRKMNGAMELVGLLQVNVQGFPVPRALAASGAPATNSDDLVSLVAAAPVLPPTIWQVVSDLKHQVSTLSKAMESLLPLASERIVASIG